MGTNLVNEDGSKVANDVDDSKDEATCQTQANNGWQQNACGKKVRIYTFSVLTKCTQRVHCIRAKCSDAHIGPAFGDSVGDGQV
jgi:hypothetical protein